MQRGLGGIARSSCLELRALPLAFKPIPLDQAVAQHAERFCHGCDLGDAGRRHGEFQFALGDRGNPAIELLQGNGDGAHGQGGEAECERQRANSAGYRKLDGEIRLTRGDVPPGDGLLLDPLHDSV